MKIIDDNLINSVVEQAKQSPRLRMNYNFHQSLDDKCHRFLNCLEPGTFLLPTGRKNAIVGIDIDYETIGANGSMLMVATSGTAVVI